MQPQLALHEHQLDEITSRRKGVRKSHQLWSENGASRWILVGMPKRQDRVKYDNQKIRVEKLKKRHPVEKTLRQLYVNMKLRCRHILFSAL